MTKDYSDTKARRAAARVGLIARKDRSHDPTVNHGGFMLVDPATGFPILGFQYDLTPEDVIGYCEET